MESEETFKLTLINCLMQQISEIEVLTSIYNEDSIILTDANALKDIKDFVENRIPYTPNHLDFTFNLVIDGLKLEISVNLPSLYPEEEPDMYIRCNQLNRQQESALNSDLTDYIKNNHLGEQCLYTAFSWVQENIDQYKNKLNEVTSPLCSAVTGTSKFSRLWIYSHHIYNKKKREQIVKIAREYNLTGFCLSGKPGVICIEGLETDCQEWWKIIKSMSWKKIVIRKSETFNITERSLNQKFKNFEEIHVDMSSFSKYLEAFGLTQVFNELFGLNNINTQHY
ncbi:RWD domain-containing protein 2B [Vanessa tameamea]|uniref:RWD domain-containing protein 2B n=1 Tax=Vanessa tameamea TaxID=334116 RepID=A0ABM4ATV9_VANTA|nr:RWD domain-containing protein 2B [Vanessa tameamea]